MEGTAASRLTVKVDTASARVNFATTSYNGSVASVAVYTTSNVVIGAADAVVLYATGSLTTTGDVTIGAVTVYATGTVVASTVTAVYAEFEQQILVNTVIVPSTSAATGLTTAHSTGAVRAFSGSTAATILSVCITTVSITVSAANANVAVWYSGSLHNSNAGQGCIVSFLADGAYASGGYTSAVGHGASVSHSGNAPDRATFFSVIEGVSAGTRSYCLTLAALANTCNISATSYTIPEFGAMELK